MCKLRSFAELNKAPAYWPAPAGKTWASFWIVMAGRSRSPGPKRPAPLAGQGLPWARPPLSSWLRCPERWIKSEIDKITPSVLGDFRLQVCRWLYLGSATLSPIFLLVYLQVSLLILSTPHSAHLHTHMHTTFQNSHSQGPVQGFPLVERVLEIQLLAGHLELRSIAAPMPGLQAPTFLSQNIKAQLANSTSPQPVASSSAKHDPCGGFASQTSPNLCLPCPDKQRAEHRGGMGGDWGGQLCQMSVRACVRGSAKMHYGKGSPRPLWPES